MISQDRTSSIRLIYPLIWNEMSVTFQAVVDALKFVRFITVVGRTHVASFCQL